jgi:hypothetical protein
VFDASLRTRAVYDIAVRYATPVWRAGVWARAACIAGLWLLLLGFPREDGWWKCAYLLLATAGVVTAWAHNRIDVLDGLMRWRNPLVRRAAEHLRDARPRATVDLAGLAEGFGIISASLLYSGPIAVHAIPRAVFATGIVLITVHIWSAFSQAMTDASWYNPDIPPPPGLVRFRPMMPPLLALVTFLLLGWPVYTGKPSPGQVLAGVLPAAVMLTLLPFTLAYETLLAAARRTCEIEADLTRQDDAITVHSLVKNATYALIRQSAADPGLGAETRSLINEVMTVTEETRLTMLGHGVTPQSVAFLWDCVLRTVPAEQRAGMTLDKDSRRLLLGKTDYGITRRVLLDLVTNGWKAGATRLSVAVQREAAAIRPRVTVLVQDDGPGMAPEAVSDPNTSLRVLAEYLRRFGGGIEFADRAGGGTRVEARWLTPLWESVHPAVPMSVSLSAPAVGR